MSHFNGVVVIADQAQGRVEDRTMVAVEEDREGLSIARVDLLDNGPVVNRHKYARNPILL